MPSGYFAYLHDLLKQRSGLLVTPDKMYLLETRLMPVARKHGYRNLQELVDAMVAVPDEALTVEVCEAMNTHESLFFRDQAPFEMFQETILPELLKRRAARRHIRIWCAACATGQEPYSLAMILEQEAKRLAGWKVEIIATDISHSVLERAKEAVFSQFEVQRGLPMQYLVKHFKQEGEYWRLSRAIRDRVRFRPFNLLDDPRPLGRFDVVMCRNVLIYFDVKTKTRVLHAISGAMAEDGVLFLGSSESTIGITEEFWPVEAGRGVYKRTDTPPCVAEQMN